VTELISKRLDCLKCPSLCCKMTGPVEVGRADIRRLAKFLGLSVPEFEAKYIVERPRGGMKRIKVQDKTCQFLSPTRRCTVYRARPKDCRGYNCWDHGDELYDYARFIQMPLDGVLKLEAKETRNEIKENEKERAKRKRKRLRDAAGT
jgi:Fe-S-cluster containining protein